ncbi:MAG: hypothetical protein HUJ72_11735 [Blautia sp.]|nr:hypothetical protein [Blautia sp.]
MAKITIEYCSQYKSYNGKEVKAGECLAPVVFSKEMIESDDTIIRDNLRTWKRFGASFTIGFMVVKEEDFPFMLSLYYSAINDYFNEHPEYKPGRCAIGWDEYGYPILCSKENRCKDCPRRSEHLPRYKSLEDFLQFQSFQEASFDEDGNEVYLDIADEKSMPVEDVAILSILFTQLFEHLEKKDHRLAVVAEYKYQNRSNEEIFAALGLKTSRGYDIIKEAEKETKKFLGL